MENPIRKLYTELTNDELVVLLSEIESCEKTGLYPNDAKIRELCRKTASITGLDVSSNLLHVQIGILREGSFRWLNIKKRELI